MTACPHCTAPNEVAAMFCASCGKAMPQAGSGPRIIKQGEFASSRGGQELQSDELVKKMKTARNALLALGVFQLLIGVGMFVVGSTSPDPKMDLRVVGVVVAAIGVFFVGLGIWAIWAPFAAAIVGLVSYVSLIALDAIGDPTSIAKGIILKIIIIGVLAKAVQAGVQHRALRKQLLGMQA